MLGAASRHLRPPMWPAPCYCCGPRPPFSAAGEPAHFARSITGILRRRSYPADQISGTGQSLCTVAERPRFQRDGRSALAREPASGTKATKMQQGWLRSITRERRQEVHDQLSEAASPGFDFFCASWRGNRHRTHAAAVRGWAWPIARPGRVVAWRAAALRHQSGGHWLCRHRHLSGAGLPAGWLLRARARPATRVLDVGIPGAGGDSATGAIHCGLPIKKHAASV
jgi:hypothetical protein